MYSNGSQTSLYAKIFWRDSKILQVPGYTLHTLNRIAKAGAKPSVGYLPGGSDTQLYSKISIINADKKCGYTLDVLQRKEK